ncbi:hypothetical protein BXY39_2568 [Eilatimonas milleporae]|uniref:Uncharacterized protein n=1 Tax=Eilatimonas milleporae TaxID=911205 RepID=A0A3M0CNY5_9PROT|nr:hypothetical protein BXY39_2568 [Eilatimonas milleporae]
MLDIGKVSEVTKGPIGNRLDPGGVTEFLES